MNLFAVWTLGLLCLVGIAHADSSNPPSVSIFGGVPALPGEFPSMIMIKFRGLFHCGATLAGASHVLTAAHCVQYLSKNASAISELIVRINSTTVSGSPGYFDRSITKIIVHPLYDPSNGYGDIAMMVLKTAVTNSKFYVKLPAELPPTTTKKPTTTKTTTTKKPTTTKTTTTKKPTTTKKITAKTTKKPAAVQMRAFNTYENQTAVITGWGTINSNGDIPESLLKANITILDNAQCLKQYPGFFVDTMLCAWDMGIDTCSGDSGGPIYVNGGVQVGITSWGMACADPYYSGVYTRVSYYVAWIKSTMASNPGPTSG